MTKIATALFALVLVGHGLIHILGFLRAFAWIAPAGPASAISRVTGVGWLLAAALFVLAAALLAVAPGWWWLVAAPALLASQILIATSWQQAKWGTLANLVILVPVVVAVVSRSASSYPAVFRHEVDRRLKQPASTANVTEADLAPLPPAVQRYLRYVGVVGKPRVHNLHVVFAGQMRATPTAPWMDINAEQYSFFDQPARLFLVRASRFGLPFHALHMYVGPSATMRVKVASLITVVDAHGPEMNQGETVTMFNDMCLLAPATLIDPAIGWRRIDEQTVEATFTNAGNTIRAKLAFAADGALTGFTSDDRFQSADGRTYRQFRWSTPVRNYRDFHGLKIAASGDAIWEQPDGPLLYARFELADLAYNVGPAGRAPAASFASRYGHEQAAH